MRNFIVLRLANRADGSVAAPVAAYENEISAWKEFYRLCGQAVDSTHYTDTVFVLTKDGSKLQSKMFTHLPEQEPEEPEEPEEPSGE